MSCCCFYTLFLHAHRETTRFFEIFDNRHAQPHTPRFTYNRAAFFNTLKSKTGLMVARAAALRTNINLADIVINIIFPEGIPTGVCRLQDPCSITKLRKALDADSGIECGAWCRQVRAGREEEILRLVRGGGLDVSRVERTFDVVS